jgi:hypothetical protein
VNGYSPSSSDPEAIKKTKQKKRAKKNGHQKMWPSSSTIKAQFQVEGGGSRSPSSAKVMANSSAVTQNQHQFSQTYASMSESEQAVVQLNARESRARIPFTPVETSKQKSTHSNTQWGKSREPCCHGYATTPNG